MSARSTVPTNLLEGPEGRRLLSRGTLVAYALPTVGTNMLHWLIMIFMIKYATDTLGLAPMLVGGLYGAARLWDALSDPLAGWGSDRTRSRWGRRRPWMLACAIPTGLGFWALWNVPTGLSELWMAAWLGGSFFVFFAALTGVAIPYLALGAELTEDHHERTRLSGARVIAEAVGIFAAIGCLHVVENAESIRTTAGQLSGWMALFAVVLIIGASIRLREPPGNQGRTSNEPLRALRDVARNPHAVRLTCALFLAEVGLGSLLAAIPFVTEVMGQPGTSALRILGFVIPFVLAVPLWVPLGRRFGKSRCYVAACGMTCIAFLMLGCLGFSQDGSGALVSMLALTAIGAAQAALRTFPASIKADVIDWDEAETGERKEGSYFAAWNLADKGAGVLSVGLVGFFLQGAEGGVDPKGVQTVVSFVPATFMAAAMWTLSGFSLSESEHARIRDRIASASA